jgi:hypothetical protein
MRVQTNLQFAKKWHPDARDPKFVKRIGKDIWGGDLELAAAASILQCTIQIIPMKGNKPILVTPNKVTGSPRPLLILGWMNDKHYTSTKPRKSRSALGGGGWSTNVEIAQA